MPQGLARNRLDTESARKGQAFWGLCGMQHLGTYRQNRPASATSASVPMCCRGTGSCAFSAGIQAAMRPIPAVRYLYPEDAMRSILANECVTFAAAAYDTAEPARANVLFIAADELRTEADPAWSDCSAQSRTSRSSPNSRRTGPSRPEVSSRSVAT